VSGTWLPNLSYPLSTQSVVAAGSVAASLAIIADPWMHDGAHLMSATLYFRATRLPDGIAAHPVSGTLSRYNANPLSAATVLNGSLTPSPNTPQGFYKDESLQSLTLSLAAADGTNNIIDRTTYQYALAVTADESGSTMTSARIIFHSVVLNFAQIANLRFQ
jgi:hypothetical protein